MSTLYYITIIPSSGGGTTFNGTFIADITTGLISAFYENGNSTDILIHTLNVDGNNNLYVSSINNFTGGGTAITNSTLYPGSNYVNIWFDNNQNQIDGLTDNTTNTAVNGAVVATVTITTAAPGPSPASCFNSDTVICCLINGQEVNVPITEMKTGMLVKSYKYGYRRVKLIGKNDMINDITKPENCMYVKYKEAERPEMSRMTNDLTVTGAHYMLLDNQVGKLNYKLDGKFMVQACFLPDFHQVNNNETYTYYHLILENDGDKNKRYGIYANGLLTETPTEEQFLKHGYILV